MDYSSWATSGFDRTKLFEQALWFSLTDEEKEQIEGNKDKAVKSKNFYDAVSNPLQMFGTGTADLTYNGLSITPKRGLSWRITQQDTLMRSVPYFWKASSWKINRALVNGIDLNCSDSKAEDLTAVQRDLKDLFQELHSIGAWGDFYGGAGGLLVFNDTQKEEDYKKPLVISKMSKGSFLGIKPLSRLYQIQPNLSSELVTEVGEEHGIYSANEIGQPKYFRVNLSGDTEAQAKYFDVHRSRLLLYSSIQLTWVEKRIEMYFGPSLLERCYSDFARYESLLAQVNKLAQRSNIPVLNVANLPQASLTNDKFVEFVTRRVKGINFGVSAGNMILLGDPEREQFKFETADFQNIVEILEHYRENLSGSLDAPASEIFDSKSTNDEKRHLTKVAEIQEREIRQWYKKLIPILYKNRYGKNLKDYGFTFKSLEMSTEKEKAEKLSMVVEMIDTLYQDNFIDVESAHDMLREAQDNVSDMFNAITEKYRQHVKTNEQPMNKMYADIELAKALNQFQGDGVSNKSVSAQAGKEKGGDPKKTKVHKLKLRKDKE
jgi:phage-related protein (TIGR01555 family)